MEVRLLVYCYVKTFLLFLAASLSQTMDTTAPGSLQVEPQKIKAATGKDATFSCTPPVNRTLLWLNPNGTDIATLNSTRISYDSAGKLHLQKLILEDSGHYTCISVDRSHNATVTLTVYVMPDYFMLTVIILAVNGGLVVIFLLCLLVSYLRGDRNRKPQKL